MLGNTVFSNKVIKRESVSVGEAVEKVHAGLGTLDRSTERLSGKSSGSVPLAKASELLSDMTSKVKSAASQINTTGIKYHN